MKIREVEEKTGMSRANIRFYEKEGLLNRIARDKINYREYTEEDVEQLRRIRILRLLEVPMEEISLYRDDKTKLNQIIKERMEALQTIVDDILDNKRIYEEVISNGKI